MRRRSRAPVFVACLLGASLCAAAETSAISSVSISRPFFNPSLGQKIQIAFTLADSGKLSVLVLDRDGFPVRRLVSEKATEKGEVSLDWDGRDDKGSVVPNEAYSLKIDLVGPGGVQSYFPALIAAENMSVTTNYYDRQKGTVSYRLPKPGRVHLQAGVAKTDPKTGEAEGPVLKTIVNREPRAAGSIVEAWNGFDESSVSYVPDLPGFVLSIAATSLPENPMIATGNRPASLERALKRSGSSLLPPAAGGHEHHQGLSALEDVAPSLKATPLDASWSAHDRVWRPSGKKVKLSFSLSGPSADSFQREPGTLYVFLDFQRVLEIPRPRSGSTAQVSVSRLSPGAHIVALNWVSDYGPVAVDTFRIVVGKPARLQPAALK